MDRFSHYIDVFPAADKTAESTVAALRAFLGGLKAQRIYCDGSQELKSACNSLQILPDTSTPNRPETNGVAERAVRRVSEGTRSVLLQSGLPHRWWAEAARCFCFLRNVCDPADGNSTFTPYQLRHKADFRGKIIPFASLVHYKPSSEKKIAPLDKYGSRKVP